MHIQLSREISVLNYGSNFLLKNKSNYHKI